MNLLLYLPTKSELFLINFFKTGGEKALTSFIEKIVKDPSTGRIVRDNSFITHWQHTFKHKNFKHTFIVSTDLIQDLKMMLPVVMEDELFSMFLGELLNKFGR